jgi:hypothetical protein
MSAFVLSHEVEADEGEALVVVDHRARNRRFAQPVRWEEMLG